MAYKTYFSPLTVLLTWTHSLTEIHLHLYFKSAHVKVTCKGKMGFVPSFLCNIKISEFKLSGRKSADGVSGGPREPEFLDLNWEMKHWMFNKPISYLATYVRQKMHLNNMTHFPSIRFHFCFYDNPTCLPSIHGPFWKKSRQAPRF